MTHLPDISWCAKGGARGYVVTRELHWWIGKEFSGWLLTVPVGTEFESSVPWVFKWVFSPDDPFYLKAAAVHDFLLERGYRNAFADVNWIEVALSVHAPAGRTWWAYRAMRLRRFVKAILGYRERPAPIVSADAGGFEPRQSERCPIPAASDLAVTAELTRAESK